MGLIESYGDLLVGQVCLGIVEVRRLSTCKSRPRHETYFLTSI